MLRRIHIHKRRPIPRRLLAPRAHLREPRPGALLRQTVIREHAADVLVLDDEPRVASVPERDSGDWIRGAQAGVFHGGERAGGPGKWELGGFWSTYSLALAVLFIQIWSRLTYLIQWPLWRAVLVQ